MVNHPKLQDIFEDVGLDNPEEEPDEEVWSALKQRLNRWCGEVERQEFLHEQTLDTLDVSTRKMESKLDAERQKLEAVLAAIQDGVCAIDRQGRLMFINESGLQLVGTDREDVDGRRLLDSFDFQLADRQLETDAILDLVTDGETLRDDDALLHRQQGETTTPVSCIISPYIPDQVVEGAVMVFRDVTDQKQAQQRLERLNDELIEARDDAVEANRAKSVFLANMSHELRTPLNAVIGYTELIEEEASDFGYDRLIPDLRKVHKAANHLLSLINDVLDLSKIEAGRQKVVWENFSVATIVEDVASTIEPRAADNSNQVVIEIDQDVGSIRADRTKLRQILLNLLSNAAKFTDDGTITLRVARASTPSGEQYRFTVSDTGIGIAEEDLHDLFEPFSQADQSTTREHEGTGLGLTITRHFCHMMGGKLEADSEEGVGTTFTASLPAPSRLESDSPIDERALNDLPAQRDDHVVLAIDDDETVHEILERYLGKVGYRLVPASSAEEGLRLARSVEPSVITLDVMMPGTDGWELLEQLKEDPDLTAIPVVMLTMLDDRKKGYALGADEFLTKPVQRDDLIGTLSTFAADTDSPRALVVEDDPPTRETMQRLLERSDWQVDTAPHGAAAFDRLAERLPEVILLDLMMPEMDGFEFLRQLRAHDDWCDLPVVVVTARTLTDRERDYVRADADKLVSKGDVNGRELVEEVDRVVRRHSLADS